MNLVIELSKEYQRILELRADYDEWCENHSHAGYWDYPGETISKGRIKRTGLMLRQSMIDMEKQMWRT